MRDIFLKAKSSVYLHEGGTKYYRLAAITVIANGMELYTLLTNYGPYNAEKAGLDGHMAKHGGTSSMVTFDSEFSLQKAFASAVRKRDSRGYLYQPSHSSEYVDDGNSLDTLQAILNEQVGVTPGHYIDIFESIMPEEITMGTTAHKEFADHIAKYQGRLRVEASDGGTEGEGAQEILRRDRGRVRQVDRSCSCA